MKMLGLIGSAGLFLSVALGAFGAHALRDHLSERMLAVFETGVRYQMFHSLAILAAAILVERNPLFQTAGLFYTAGIFLFSFSLYFLAVTEIRWLGAITPFGGLCFLAGHAVMFYAFLKTGAS
ncbi:MAG TPA: DUF423 domain-containing protein [Acidobacteriota bacterium]|nr:DUF423 domain-containing protein [Acidobacteriota bacterium]